MFKQTKVASGVLIMIGTSLALSVTTAVAQVQTVEVTGSRLRQIDKESAQPVITMTQEEIQKSGLITVGDIINSMTVAGSPDFSRASVLTSNREQGGQFINLRGLGSQRLLVLVDGKRWTQSVAGYTDMSTVPAALIERIEVLRDGASAVYGSDAIAGVVNIIMKKNMKGASLSVYTGQNSLGDGKSTDASFTMGANNDTGSIIFGLTRTTQGAVWAKSREVSSYSYGNVPGKENYFGTGPWGRIGFVNPTTGSVLSSTLGGLTGSTQVLNHTGGALGDGVGTSSRNPVNYHAYASPTSNSGADLFNSTSQMMLLMPTEMSSAFTKATLELTPNMRAYTTFMASDRSSNRQVAGYPMNSQVQASYPVYIDKDSYFNPYGNQVAGAGLGRDLFFYRRTIEVPRVTDNTSKSIHFDGGLQGETSFLGNQWNWNAGINYNNVQGNWVQTGNLHLPNLKKALGPSFMNAAGVVQCGTPTAPLSIKECVPFDILGGPSASNKAALDYAMSVGQGTYGSTVMSYLADVSGEIATLPAGKVGLAMGIERREVSGYDRPGQFEQSGLSTDLAANTTVGKFKVNEAYVETNIPLVKNAPMVDSLSVNLASRHSDYSNYGTTSNSKISFLWKPNSQLLIRGTKAEGFRAPTVGDTFGGGGQSYDNYLDPCDSRYGSASRDAAVAARCAAAGVPTGFKQVNQVGSAVGSGGGQTPFPFSTGAGNTSLKPETATTQTVGFVANPKALPGLTASVDWYRIEVDNRISAISTPYVLGQCYTFGVQAFCSSIIRDAVTGQVRYLERGNLNLGALSTEGIDIGLAYSFPANQYGKFNIRSQSSYVKNYKSKSTNTGNFTDFAGEYDTYRFKSNTYVDWSKDSYFATFGTRYVGSVKSQCWDDTTYCTDPDATATWGTGVNKIKAQIYNDLTLGYKTSSKGQFLVGVNNLFNVKPKVILDSASGFGGSNSSSAIDPTTPVDRFMFVRFTQAF